MKINNSYLFLQLILLNKYVLVVVGLNVRRDYHKRFLFVNRYYTIPLFLTLIEQAQC